MSRKEESKTDKILREYQRRWIKPTVITLLIILLPILTFGLYHSKTIINARSNYNSNTEEIWQLIKRDNKQKFFDNTPNYNDHVIAETQNDLPPKPYLVAFYMQHCPYCEVVHDSIKHNEEQIKEIYPSIETPVVYVDVKSPIGQELIHEHEVMAASSLMLIAEDESDNMLVMSGTQGPLGEPSANKSEILKIFQKLDDQLYQYVTHENQRNRINQ